MLSGLCCVLSEKIHMFSRRSSNVKGTRNITMGNKFSRRSSSVKGTRNITMGNKFSRRSSSVKGPDTAACSKLQETSPNKGHANGETTDAPFKNGLIFWIVLLRKHKTGSCLTSSMTRTAMVQYMDPTPETRHHTYGSSPGPSNRDTTS